MSSPPDYIGKPTVYLDQNILDLFVDNGLDKFGENLSDKFQIVYSDETLKEIRRSKGYEDKFLNVLSALKAFHLKIVLTQSDFRPTGNATITDRDVFEAFSEYCENDSEYAYVEDALNQWLYKFSGGRKGETFHDIFAEQKGAFSKLTDSINQNAADLPQDVTGLLFEHTKGLDEQFSGILSDLESKMNEGIADQENWEGAKQYREDTGIGPKQLNNIQEPKVLEQIWQLHADKRADDDPILDINKFYNINTNPLDSEQPYFKYQVVTGLYNMLNTIGYYPDSKMHKEKRFVAALSDNSHASIAAFCDVLLSRDEAFIKKVRAVYEYLEISTAACLVELKP
jgi:hypothetical protein